MKKVLLKYGKDGLRECFGTTERIVKDGILKVWKGWMKEINGFTVWRELIKEVA